MVFLYSVKNVSLNIFGSTINGYVTSVSQRFDRDSESKAKRYKNTVYYYFKIGEKKYESFVTYNTNIPIIRKENQEKEKVTVQYFKFFPQLSTLKKYNENKPINYIAWGLLSIFCIFGILLVNGVIDTVKKGGKK